MDIEELVQKYERLIPAGAYTLGEGIRAAMTEQAETHAIEMRAYEATVANQAERIRQLEVALTGMVAIAHDSDGVAGYHLNGDVADWYSFPEYEDAVIALAATAQQKEGVK